MANVIAAQTLREGILADYRDAYSATRRDMDSRVGMVMDLSAFTDGRSQTRGYFEAAPHPSYQPQGSPIKEEAMEARAFTTINHPYSLRIPWHKDDREDDRTGSLRDMAGEGGRGHGILPERGLFDLLSGTASTIPAVPNAADGTAVFSSSTRFEVSTGNSLTVTSWSASGPAARSALWAGVEQFGLFKDGKGQPLFQDSHLDSPILVIHAMADLDILSEALHQGLVAYANSTSNAGVDNVLVEGGRKFVPWPTQRVATGTMYLCLTGAPVKPFLMQPRTQIVESYADETNDPESRNTGKEYVQWRQRLGFGVGVVYQVIKIVAA